MKFFSEILLQLFFSIPLVLTSNTWEDFDGYTIYPKYNLTDCVFPFVYRSKTYVNCTTDGDNGDRPWCALHSNYIGLFKTCYDYWNSNLKCVFPFYMNNVRYDDCAILVKRPEYIYKQCRSNSDDPRYKYIYCIDQHIKKTGRPLIHSDNCPSNYASMTKDHTKCAGPSDFAIPRPISSDGQQALIDLHNQYRAAVPAANMLKTYWDPELATMSQNHCNMCGFDHDLAENRISVKYGWKNGQNMIVTTDQRSPATDLFSMMYDAEQKRFAFGVGCNDTTKAGCLHYTQAMLSNINLMGCSQTDCIYPDQVQRFCCCNYIQSQYANSYMTPYQKGSPCSACPNNCDKKKMLCDCGTKVCPNGQSLDAVCNCGDPKKRQHNSNDENDSLYKRSEDILEAEEKRDQNTEEIVDPVYIYHSPTGEISGREFVNIRAEKRRKHNNIRPEKRKFNHIIPAKRNENTEEIVDPVYIYHSPTGEISGREFVNIRAEKRRKHNNIRPEKRRFNHITPAKRRFNHITPAKRRFNHITPAKRRFNHITPAKRRFNHIKPTRDELVRSIDQMVDELEQKQQRSTNLMMEQNEMEENI